MATKKQSVKRKPKAKAEAPPAPVPEMWRCTEPWLRNFMGRDFKKGDGIMIHPSQITDAVLETLQQNFEKIAMEATTVVSENIEELEEA